MSDDRTGERATERVRLEDPLAAGADHLTEEFEGRDDPDGSLRRVARYPADLLGSRDLAAVTIL